jgi:ASC-1-like (ASCH) protein
MKPRKIIVVLLSRYEYYINKFFPKIIKSKHKLYVNTKGTLKLKKIIVAIFDIFLKFNLHELFMIFNSDKYKNYEFLYKIVENNFSNKSKLNILEIGIGGHNLNYVGGGSLLALSFFFKKSKVFGLDLFDKSFLDTKKIKTFVSNQNELDTFEELLKDTESFDLIIDDGSHFVNHQLKNFNFLYTKLKNNGIYIIEDIVGSYRLRNNGSPDLDINKNLISYFGQFLHSVNYDYLTREKQDKFKIFKDIESLSFSKNCIYLKKKYLKEDKFFTNENAYSSLDDHYNSKNKLIKKDEKGFMNFDT